MPVQPHHHRRARTEQNQSLVVGAVIAGILFTAYAALKFRKSEAAALDEAAPVPVNNVPRVDNEPELLESAPPVSESWLGQQKNMVKTAVNSWLDDYAPSMGAALSYYTLFSLAPLLLIVIGVAGMFFGQATAQAAIVGQLSGVMGPEGAIAVEAMLKAAREPAKGALATLVGVVMLVVGATAVFAELQSALDRIWRVPAPKSESGLWYLLRTRLLSFGLVLGLGFLLMVSLVVSAALAALGQWWASWIQGWDVLLEMLNLVVSIAIFTLLFAMIYKIMPRARISWRDVWTGAAVTAVLFAAGKALVGLYLGKTAVASGFGAAGSVVLLIAWVYYSAQIFLLGAEYTWVYSNRCGSRVGDAVANASVLPQRAEH